MNRPSQKNESSPLRPEVHKIVFKRALPYNLQQIAWKLAKSCPFFMEMTSSEVTEFLRLCQRETFPKREVIFREGETGERFFLILSGAVVIQLGDWNVRIKPGGVFGEMAILENMPRSATAVAAEETTVFSMTRQVFEARMPSVRTKVLANLAKQLSARLRQTNGVLKNHSKEESALPNP